MTEAGEAEEAAVVRVEAGAVEDVVTMEIAKVAPHARVGGTGNEEITTMTEMSAPPRTPMVSSEEVVVPMAAATGVIGLTQRTVKGVCSTDLAAAEVEAGVVEAVGTVAIVRNAPAGVSLIATVLLAEGK